MKTLVNKNNPKIRITAPEIVLTVNKEEYWIAGIPQIPRTYLAKDWTLVEEEENISWADRLKERLENMTQEEFEKAMNEMYVDGDESPTLEEYLKAAYHSPIETEPVDLEKAAVEYQLKTRGRLNVMGGDAVLSKEEYMKFNSNKDFIAGARWMAEQMKGGSK